MFCRSCGIQIEEGAQFCQNCGVLTTETKNIKEGDGETSSVNKMGNKNYSHVFWKYFWIGFVLNIFSRGAESVEGAWFWVFYLILAIVYIYKFSETINKAMLSIGKKNWWPLGLLSIVPFGFWVAFLIVRAKLKPHGMWISEHKSFKMSKKI